MKAKFKPKGDEENERARSLPRGPDIRVVGSKTATNYVTDAPKAISSKEVEMPVEDSQSLGLNSQTFAVITNLAATQDDATNSVRSRSESRSTTKVLLTQALPSHRNAECKPLELKIIQGTTPQEGHLTRAKMSA